MTDVRDALDLLITKVGQVENLAIPTRSTGKSLTQERAELTRQLLYLQHLCRRVEQAVMDEYWHTRGQNDHLAYSQPTERLQ